MHCIQVYAPASMALDMEFWLLPTIIHAWVALPLPTSSKICRLLMTFAYSLDPDQARQNVGPDMGPLMLFLKENFEKSNVEKYWQTTKNHEKLPSMQRAHMFKLNSCTL